MYECSLDRMKDKISTFSKFGDAGHGGNGEQAAHGGPQMAAVMGTVHTDTFFLEGYA